MRKIEQKLLKSFMERKEFHQGFDKISVDKETKIIYYYNYGRLVFANSYQEDIKEKMCYQIRQKVE